jgi:PAS domain S-box-containing protein
MALQIGMKGHREGAEVEPWGDIFREQFPARGARILPPVTFVLPGLQALIQRNTPTADETVRNTRRDTFVINEFNTEHQFVLDALVEGICGIDAEGTITFCNEALSRMTGYSKEEIVGKNMHDLLHHSREDGSKYPRQDCDLSRAIVDRKPAQEFGGPLWKRDGCYIPVEYCGRPMQRFGNRTCYVATIRDLSEIELAKEALRRSDEQYRRILESMPDVAWTSDVQGGTRYVSPKVEALLGFTNRELYAGGTHLWLNQIHPEDFGRVSQKYMALFENKVAFDEEYRIRRKDGTWIWVHDRATRTHEANGMLCADGFMSDITQRKQAEAELRSKTAFLEAQANSTIDGLLVVDRNGRRLMVNERFAELLRIPPELMADLDDRSMLDFAVSLMKNPESFRAKVEYLYRHPTDTSRDEIELKNGVILDRYSAPVVDKNGIYYGRIWNFRDITEQKRNQEALQQLSLAVEQSPTSVVITDPQGNISYVNRKFTECTGYSLQEVLGQNPRVLNARQCPAELYRDLWSTITQGRVWHGEFCNKKKDGEIYWESATITPMTNPNGEITHFLALKEDITEKRSLESQLRHAQKMEGVGQLAAGIAHEINTPTQFVMDNLTFLRDSWKSAHELLEQYRGAVQGIAGSIPDEVAGRLKQAEQACDLEFIRDEVPRAIEQSLDGSRRVAKIVRAMKEFSHPDSAEKTATDMNRAVESTITVARNEWKYVSEVVKEFDDQLPPVVCYPGDINQVVLNLLVNAAHAIKEKVKDGEKGRIVVRTRMSGEDVEISVSDNGNGIPDAIRNRVFEPFFTTKEVGKGTGQGLALAYTVVVKKHGGKIWFESEVGKGTTFFITLPLSLSVAAKGGA